MKIDITKKSFALDWFPTGEMERENEIGFVQTYRKNGARGEFVGKFKQVSKEFGRVQLELVK